MKKMCSARQMFEYSEKQITCALTALHQKNNSSFWCGLKLQFVNYIMQCIVCLTVIVMVIFVDNVSQYL